MLRTWVGDERRIRDGDDEKMKEVAYMSMLRLSGWSAVTPFFFGFFLSLVLDFTYQFFSYFPYHFHPVYQQLLTGRPPFFLEQRLFAFFAFFAFFCVSE